MPGNVRSCDVMKVNNLTVNELKDELERRGLKAMGQKEVLVQRLKAALDRDALGESSGRGDEEQGGAEDHDDGGESDDERDEDFVQSDSDAPSEETEGSNSGICYEKEEAESGRNVLDFSNNFPKSAAVIAVNVKHEPGEEEEVDIKAETNEDIIIDATRLASGDVGPGHGQDDGHLGEELKAESERSTRNGRKRLHKECTDFNHYEPLEKRSFLLQGSPSSWQFDEESEPSPSPFDCVDEDPAWSIEHEEDCNWYEDDWQPNTFTFTPSPGPLSAAAELDSKLPADFLELFLTDELLQHIADHTNLYATQYFQAQSKNQPQSSVCAWKPVSIPELKTFLGLTFLTSYVKKPTIELYWTVGEVDSTPYFSQTMSRNRFQLIWKFLNYNINTTEDDSDIMCEVRPVFDYITEKFKEMYQPGQNICIDEGVMQWRGRVVFKEYNPEDPAKNGIKLYILCDSATGYCFNMHPDFSETHTTSDIVFTLLDRLPGHGYTLHMDDFYNSVAMCELLLGAETNVCGIMKKNRGEPSIFTKVTKNNLRVEEKLARHNKRVMVVAWQDKLFLTTCHEDRMQKVEVTYRGPRYKGPKVKPECVVAYKSYMIGVDKLDQNVSYYPFVRRSMYWSKKFVAYLFQLCMFNAHVLYRARNPRDCKTLLEFMHKVVKSWTVTRYGEVQVKQEEAEHAIAGCADFEYLHVSNRGRRRSDPHSRLDGQLGKHKLEYMKPSAKSINPERIPGRSCRVCKSKGLRKESRMWCASCCVALHPGECFTAYHTKQNYSV